MKIEKYNSQMDGMDSLLSVFENENDFVLHFFQHVKFFRPEMVAKQAKDIHEIIMNEDPLPVRFSLKSKKYFHYINTDTNSGKSKKAFKNKSDAQSFTLEKGLTHNDTGINVCIDKDGNYFVRKQIFDAINYRVSQGAISDITNYMICHVWGETANPLFFTSLWNITLIPHYMSFLTDKPDENSPLVKRIKDVLKAICIELYNPQELLKVQNPEYDASKFFAFQDVKNLEDRKYVDDIQATAKKYIKDGVVHFIDKKPNAQSELKLAAENSVDDNLDNKTFILQQLEKLADVEDESLIEVLANAKECKNKFDVAFSILREYNPDDKSVFDDNLGRQRYYKKDTFFEYNDKKYIICNHWYPKQRDLFELWVYDNINL